MKCSVLNVSALQVEELLHLIPSLHLGFSLPGYEHWQLSCSSSTELKKDGGFHPCVSFPRSPLFSNWRILKQMVLVFVFLKWESDLMTRYVCCGSQTIQLN